MTAEKLENTLKHLVTVYDKKQSNKKFYNPHALGIYFKSIEETVIPYFKKSGDHRGAISQGFNDRLHDFLQKSVD